MAAPTQQPVPLLMTKLYIPRARSEFVLRSRMFQRLETGLRGNLTLVSAPAGFGKTTLVSSWCRHRVSDDQAIAWLSLDERDNDPGEFLVYLVEAIRLAVGDDRSGGSAPDPRPEAVITRLINRVGEVDGQIVLVLDDFHVIKNRDVLSAVDYLIEHQPPQLHVVITSRTEPPLSLSRLRGRGELVEIGADELRFTIDEAEAFLRHATGREIAEADVRELERRTEGWVTGLQLAAISLRDQDDVRAFIDEFSGQHRHVFDYLVDEVLERQPSATQQFLLHTSLFERFTAELCEAVTGRRDSHAVIDELERANLFITPLDGAWQWFRYHQLFAELLQRRLRQAEPDVVPELRRRASVWFEARRDYVEALRQAIEGEDWPRVSSLITAHWQLLFNQGHSRTLLQLLRAVPDDVVLSSPWLLLTRAWAANLNGERERAARDTAALAGLLERIERDPQRSGEISQEDWRKLRGSLVEAAAFDAIMKGDFDSALKHCDEALGWLAEEDFELRSMFHGIGSQALWLLGDLERSAEYAREMIELSALAEAPLARIIGLLSLGSIEVEWGLLDLAAERYRLAVEFAAGQGLAEWQYTGRVLTFQCEIPYERNDLDLALEIAQRARKITGYWASEQAYDGSYLQLGRIYVARREIESAREILSQAPRPSSPNTSASEVAQVDALLALIDLESGERGKLEEIERDLTTPALGGYERVWLWMPAMRARAQVLNTARRRDDAVSILAPLVEVSFERGWVRQAVQAGSVLAVSHAGRGDQDAAIHVFERVLTLAEPRGFLRSILDAGRGIDAVIEAAREHRRAEDANSTYLTRLLDLAREDQRQEKVLRPGAASGLVEPLSGRELEVLRMIAAGHTNAAIAERLFVVVGTVKAHASNIYGKLGVTNRTQAINRARELGLID